MFKILDKRELCEKIHQYRIDAPHVVRKAKAGQFVILRKDELGERVPMSIGGLDKETRHSDCRHSGSRQDIGRHE